MGQIAAQRKLYVKRNIPTAARDTVQVPALGVVPGSGIECRGAEFLSNFLTKHTKSHNIR